MRLPAVMTRLNEWMISMIDDGLLEKSGGDYQPERRRHPRYRPTGMVWRIHLSDELQEGTLENISMGGACIRCGEGIAPPEPGTVITVSFARSGPDPLTAEVIAISRRGDESMLHLAWSLDQDHAVERVNSLLLHASR